MLYNEQIEALISAALADGVLTEKEKQVLFKKAQAQGIDLDEFEMVLDARLVELKKAEKAKAEASAPKSTKLGDVKKCPACGAIVQSFLGVCPECGYAFEGLEANSSAKKLAEELEKVSAEWDCKIQAVDTRKNGSDEKIWEIKKGKEQALANTIKGFPIPNTKADLFEFITMTQATFLNPSTSYYSADAYRGKYNEALIKAKALFANDPLFCQLISDKAHVDAEYKVIHRRQKKAGMKPSTKNMIALLLLLLLLMLILILSFMATSGNSQRAITTPSICLEKVEKAIDKGDYKKAKNLIVKFSGGKDSYDGSVHEIGDCHESVVALERALLQEDRYEEAEEIYEIFMDKISNLDNKKELQKKVEAPLQRYKSKNPK